MRIVAGEARGRKISAPKGNNTRPTLDRVRENLFNIIQNDIAGRQVLDLFSGSGALGLEALSRGAARAVLVDHDRKANYVQRLNVEALGYQDRARIIKADWSAAIQQLRDENTEFDIVFLDPPYEADYLQAVFKALIPLISGNTLVILEHEGKKEFYPPEQYHCIKHRTWGYCGISIFKLAASEND